jgi:hypothetical protein
VSGAAGYLSQNLVGVNTASNYTLSFWYLPTTEASTLVVYVASSFRPTVNVTPQFATPGAANSVVSPLPPYPTLWLNEVQPVNVNGVTDNAGEREPWVELFNPGASVISLEGGYLSDNYTNLLSWAFPSNAVVHPGQFLVVWADGEPGESTATEWHTRFRLGRGTGAVTLARVLGNAPQILDYLNFDSLPADWSYGAVPDGQPFSRFALSHPTPGGTNNATSPPLVVYINEWMAANNRASGIADPADGDFDDWFELYNPGASPADLGGCFLTDNLTNRFQFEIPDNGHYAIPAGGFLLVWADSEPDQNSTHRADLHVSFNLRAAGEVIGLFAADGTPIDAVTFGPQTDNLSMGRDPDGSGNVVFLPVSSPRGGNSAGPSGPVVTDIVASGGTVTLTFTSQPGLRYRVQFKDDLGDPTWTDLPGDITASGGSSSKTDPTVGTQRFYRVVQVG